MCNPAMAMMAFTVASGAYTAYNQNEQGKQEEKWSKYQAKQAQADANAEVGAAEVRANNIRRAARLKASSANAAMAASGVQTGEGMALEINKDIFNNSEYDAQMEIFGGGDASARRNAEGQAFTIKGQQAAQAGKAAAAGTLLQTAGTVAGGWKTMSGAPTGEK